MTTERPHPVELILSIESMIRRNDDTFRPSCSSHDDPNIINNCDDENDCNDHDNEAEQQKRMLLSNLYRYGYSPLKVRFVSTKKQEDEGMSGDENNSNRGISVQELQQFWNNHDQWKRWITEMVQCYRSPEQPTVEPEQQQQQNAAATKETTNNSRLLYRGISSESGSAVLSEPKESLEWKRNCHNNVYRESNNNTTLIENNNNQYEKYMMYWTNLFHLIVTHIHDNVLQFPKGCLIHPTTMNDDNNNDINVDLLRAFYYHKETDSTTTATTEPTRMGSNEHTDWGSFTIIWQQPQEEDNDYNKSIMKDSCLQTYCTKTNQWIDISSSRQQSNSNTTSSNSRNDNNYSSTSYVDLIIHLGDITSLAINHHSAPAEDHRMNANKSENKIIETSLEGTAKNNMVSVSSDVCWASPLHRVLSPKLTERCSLVYFCYPSPTKSMEQIIHELDASNWINNQMFDKIKRNEPVTNDKNNSNENNAIQYESYYLLQNQSSPPIVFEYSDNGENQNNGNSHGKDEIKSMNNNDNASRREKAMEQYNRIVSKPIGYVLNEKWEQVQRS